MNNIVFDSSVILALLKAEKMDVLLPNLNQAVMSAVNVAEVWTKLVQGNRFSQLAGEYILESLREIVPFSEDQALLSGKLSLEPGDRALSLGDRACLALAITASAEVYTADRAWARLKLPCNIRLIR